MEDAKDMGLIRKNRASYSVKYAFLCLIVLMSVVAAPAALAKNDNSNKHSNQEATLPPPNSPDANKKHVQNEMIVRLNSGYTLTKDELKSVDATVLDTIPDLNIYRISYDSKKVESDEITAFASLPMVQYVDLNYISNEVIGNPWISDFGFQTEYQQQYAASELNSSAAQQLSQGAGVTVAVLDTGVNLQHPAIAPHLSKTQFDFINNNTVPNDVPGGIASGHGTGVAGLVLLAAPQSQIMPLRVLDQTGQGTLWNVLKAIKYAVDNGANVINMSLGTTANTNSMADLVNYATQQNVVVVASAGNDGANEAQYPCDYTNVICVAATDSLYHLAPFSNYGSAIALTAPGVALYAPYLDNSYATWSGTSMSSALVSGGAALVESAFKNATPSQVAAHLEKGATPIDSFNPGFQNELGSGCLNLLQALQP